MSIQAELQQTLRPLWFSATRARSRNIEAYKRDGIPVNESRIAQGVTLAEQRGNQLLDLVRNWEDTSLSLHARLGLFEQIQATLTHPEVETAMHAIMQRIDERGKEYVARILVAKEKRYEEIEEGPWRDSRFEGLARARAQIEEYGLGEVVLIPTSQGGMLIREAAGTYKIIPGSKQDVDVVAFFDARMRSSSWDVVDAVSQIMGEMFAIEHSVNPDFPDGFSKDSHNALVPSYDSDLGLTPDDKRLAQQIEAPDDIFIRQIGMYFMHGYPEEIMHRERQRILHALHLSYKKDPVKWQEVIDKMITHYQKSTQWGEYFDIDLVKTKYLRWDNYHDLYDKRVNNLSRPLLEIRSKLLRDLLEQTATAS